MSGSQASAAASNGGGRGRRDGRGRGGRGRSQHRNVSTSPRERTVHFARDLDAGSSDRHRPDTASVPRGSGNPSGSSDRHRPDRDSIPARRRGDRHLSDDAFVPPLVPSSGPPRAPHRANVPIGDLIPVFNQAGKITRYVEAPQSSEPRFPARRPVESVSPPPALRRLSAFPSESSVDTRLRNLPSTCTRNWFVIFFSLEDGTSRIEKGTETFEDNVDSLSACFYETLCVCRKNTLREALSVFEQKHLGEMKFEEYTSEFGRIREREFKIIPEISNGFGVVHQSIDLVFHDVEVKILNTLVFL